MADKTAVEERVDRSFVPGIEKPTAVLRPRRRRLPGPMQVVVLALLVLFAIIFTYPMLWLVAASLKPGPQVFSAALLPDPVMWSNYPDLLRQMPRFDRWFTNSVVVSGLAAGTVTLSSAFVAFGFAYFRFPYRNVIFGIVLATMMLPGAVTMIPTFLIWQELGFYNTLVPLWAGNLFASAFYVFLLRQFFLGLPRELFEAARVDGAGYIRMWRSVALPLTLPALVVVFIFELKASWTDLLKPLIFLRNIDLFTLPRGLLAVVESASITGEGHWELLMAAAVITTLPMVILFFIGQRYFVEGIATTGTKG
jgi:multiple sugar transport system permease protein